MNSTIRAGTCHTACVSKSCSLGLPRQCSHFLPVPIASQRSLHASSVCALGAKHVTLVESGLFFLYAGARGPLLPMCKNYRTAPALSFRSHPNTHDPNAGYFQWGDFARRCEVPRRSAHDCISIRRRFVVHSHSASQHEAIAAPPPA